MYNAITSAPDLEGSNYLIDIAARIKVEHQAVAASLKQSVHHAIAAGELLLEAKEQVPHGEWLPWLEEHCGVTPRSAQGYMRLARHRAELEGKYETHVSHLTVREALNALAAPTIAISSLETEEARSAAVEAIASGTNIRTAVRGVRKLDYNARVQSATPKALEGTYKSSLRIVRGNTTALIKPTNTATPSGTMIAWTINSFASIGPATAREPSKS